MLVTFAADTAWPWCCLGLPSAEVCLNTNCCLFSRCSAQQQDLGVWSYVVIRGEVDTRQVQRVLVSVPAQGFVVASVTGLTDR